MNMQKSYIYVLAAWMCMLMLPGVSMAQADSKKHETIQVHFRQGSKTLDPKYMDNAEALEELAELLKPYVLDASKGKGRIHIMASASPEGSVEIGRAHV